MFLLREFTGARLRGGDRRLGDSRMTRVGNFRRPRALAPGRRSALNRLKLEIVLLRRFAHNLRRESIFFIFLLITH